MHDGIFYSVKGTYTLATFQLGFPRQDCVAGTGAEPFAPNKAFCGKWTVPALARCLSLSITRRLNKLTFPIHWGQVSWALSVGDDDSSAGLSTILKSPTCNPQ
jgi:hypothetical protein